MDSETLAELEQAIEPYRQAGFIVTSQSEGAITLVHPPEKFSCLIFLIALVLFWPVAIAYLILFNNRKERSACVRVTSQGYVEESGFTLAIAERERRRDRRLKVIIIAIPLLIAVAVFALLLLRSLVRP